MVASQLVLRVSFVSKILAICDWVLGVQPGLSHILLQNGLCLKLFAFYSWQWNLALYIVCWITAIGTGWVVWNCLLQLRKKPVISFFSSCDFWYRSRWKGCAVWALINPHGHAYPAISSLKLFLLSNLLIIQLVYSRLLQPGTLQMFWWTTTRIILGYWPWWLERLLWNNSFRGALIVGKPCWFLCLGHNFYQLFPFLEFSWNDVY